jgi:hypothetical protein
MKFQTAWKLKSSLDTIPDQSSLSDSLENISFSSFEINVFTAADINLFH